MLGKRAEKIVITVFFKAVTILVFYPVSNSLTAKESSSLKIDFIFLIDANLHTPMYFFLSNLSFLDLCYSTSTLPRMLRDLLSVNKVISYGECVAQMYISLSLGVCECVLLAVMAYDRYVAICYPLHYTTIMSKMVCIRLAESGESYINMILSILKIASSSGRRKAFSTCSSHMMVVTIFYGSAMASYMKPRSSSLPATNKVFALLYFIVTPMLNPMIYTLKNNDVKAAFMKLIKKNKFF
ncbi:olfactory receptor 2B2-like [Eleutherodactylus coqui]|uniref:olfactory receptor 2B2-like n=1 Tax=Eleutherodactylus coqui TaxID=57060 RepID=UPI00346344D6